MEQPFSIFYNSFSNFDYFEHVTKGWDLNIKKLNKGNYQGSLLQIINKKVIISDVNIGSTLEINGAPLNGYKSFGVPKINVAPFYWRYNNLSDETIQIYRPGSELFMINKYEMEAIDVAIEENHFNRLCLELKFNNVHHVISKNEFVMCDLNLLRELQNRLAQLSNNAKKLDPSNYNLITNEVNYEIPILLIKALASVNQTPKIAKPLARTLAIKKVVELVEAAPTDYFNLSDLSNATNVSERTLQYSFKERFGLSPTKFIKNTKLNIIHKSLIKNSSRNLSISDIANQYGFWHMGQFAKDYYVLFRELPSVTLKKNIN